MMPRVVSTVIVEGARPGYASQWRKPMWWGIGIGGGILYLALLFTLGLMTLRNGHGWMFFFGIFIPVLWLIGALMRPPEARVGGV